MIPRCDVVAPDPHTTNIHRCISAPGHPGQHECACGRHFS